MSRIKNYLVKFLMLTLAAAAIGVLSFIFRRIFESLIG